jgi:transposase
VLDAIFYLVRGGIAGRQLPTDFPPATTGYGTFRRWAAAGAWAGIHDLLRDRARVRAGRHPSPTAAVIDSASVRGADTVPARSRGLAWISKHRRCATTKPWPSTPRQWSTSR